MATSRTEQYLCLTVAALQRVAGDDQNTLAAALGLSQGQVSRKVRGQAGWTFADLDKLSAHYRIPVPDLLCGPTHAVEKLPASRRTAVLGGRQQVLHVVSG